MPRHTGEQEAGEIIFGAAHLLNDPSMTDYNVTSMLPYLNMGIHELNQHLMEANVGITNDISPPIHVKLGDFQIQELPTYLIEVQEVAERQVGSDGAFIALPRREFPDNLPKSNSLLYWSWIGQRVVFNLNGALNPMEVQLKYVRMPVLPANDETTIIGSVSVKMYLTYKTAALCAQFIGENDTRAGILNHEAESALERIIGISNKGKQQIMTRHRPFRAAYKMRGY